MSDIEELAAEFSEEDPELFEEEQQSEEEFWSEEEEEEEEEFEELEAEQEFETEEEIGTELETEVFKPDPTIPTRRARHPPPRIARGVVPREAEPLPRQPPPRRQALPQRQPLPQRQTPPRRQALPQRQPPPQREQKLIRVGRSLERPAGAPRELAIGRGAIRRRFAREGETPEERRQRLNPYETQVTIPISVEMPPTPIASPLAEMTTHQPLKPDTLMNIRCQSCGKVMHFTQEQVNNFRAEGYSIPAAAYYARIDRECCLASLMSPFVLPLSSKINPEDPDEELHIQPDNTVVTPSDSRGLTSRVVSRYGAR